MLPNRVDVFLRFQQALTDVRVFLLSTSVWISTASNNNGGSVIQKKRKTRLFKRPLRSTVKLLIPVNFVLLKRNSFSRSFQTLRAGFKVYSSVLRVEHIEVVCLVFCLFQFTRFLFTKHELAHKVPRFHYFVQPMGMFSVASDFKHGSKLLNTVEPR